MSNGKRREAIPDTTRLSDFRRASQLSWLRLIASGQHLSAVAKHDQSTRILLDAGSVD
jgi:hypothetical protein